MGFLEVKETTSHTKLTSEQNCHIEGILCVLHETFEAAVTVLVCKHRYNSLRPRREIHEQARNYLRLREAFSEETENDRHEVMSFSARRAHRKNQRANHRDYRSGQ